MKQKLVIILKASQDFIRHTSQDIKSNAPVLNSFFESITNFYIPILNMLDSIKLKNNGKLSMVLPPVLCSLLTDNEIKSLYLDWLSKKIELGKKELERNSENKNIQEIVKRNLEKIYQTKSDFEEKYNSDLISAFAKNKKEGKLELLATCATDIFIPHYAETKEVISAQIECGLTAYRQYFGEIPEGFWLPELGYYPGVEKLIKAYGFSYTVLDSRAFLLAKKMPTKGIFYPVRTENSLVVFSNCTELDDKIFDEKGYISNENYLNSNKDIGFELKMEELSPFMEIDSVRYSTSYKYFNKSSSSESNLYNFEKASEQAKIDATDFAKTIKTKLDKVEKCIPESDFINLFYCLELDSLKNWDESILWLKNFLESCDSNNLELSGGTELIKNQYSLEKFEPYYSAKGDGYGEEFLNGNTSWMMRYIKKASERIVDLADRFPNDTGLKTRLLNLGAKELLMAQSVGLIKMINSCDNPDFAERRFKESIRAFTSVFDSLGSNTVSTEWLTTIEMQDSIFPWMNYKVFAKKV